VYHYGAVQLKSGRVLVYGEVSGVYRKQPVIPASEDWSLAGPEAAPVVVPSVAVQVLVCADVGGPVAAGHRAKGAQVLVEIDLSPNWCGTPPDRGKPGPSLRSPPAVGGLGASLSAS